MCGGPWTMRRPRRGLRPLVAILAVPGLALAVVSPGRAADEETEAAAARAADEPMPTIKLVYVVRRLADVLGETFTSTGSTPTVRSCTVFAKALSARKTTSALQFPKIEEASFEMPARR